MTQPVQELNVREVTRFPDFNRNNGEEIHDEAATVYGANVLAYMTLWLSGTDASK